MKFWKSYFLLTPIAYIECMPHLTFLLFQKPRPCHQVQSVAVSWSVTVQQSRISWQARQRLRVFTSWLQSGRTWELHQHWRRWWPHWNEGPSGLDLQTVKSKFKNNNGSSPISLLCSHFSLMLLEDLTCAWHE